MSRSMQLLKTSKQLLTLMKVNLKDKMADFSKRPNVINRAYDYYEDLIGVKEVRMSQQKVLVAESEFAKSSKQRREIQAMLTGIQEQLKQIRQKLDQTHRGDEAYLNLITNEHKLIKNEIKCIDDLRYSEDLERDLFDRFSHTLRDSQEVERLRQEKTKYLSLILSIVGALLGIIGTTVNHSLKMKDFKKILDTIQVQQQQLQTVAQTEAGSADTKEFVSHLRALSQKTVDNHHQKTSEVNDKSLELISKLEESQKLNNELTDLIQATKSSIEYKMKVNALMTVVITYGLIAITVPIISKFLGD